MQTTCVTLRLLMPYLVVKVAFRPPAQQQAFFRCDHLLCKGQMHGMSRNIHRVLQAGQQPLAACSVVICSIHVHAQAVHTGCSMPMENAHDY